MGMTDLPPEIIEEIFLQSDPLEVARVAQCSRYLRSIVYPEGDAQSILWRDLYLAQPLDDPRVCISHNGSPRSDIDWKGELQQIIRARTVLGDISLCRPGERCVILKTLLNMVCYVPPLSSSGISATSAEISKTLVWVGSLLEQGSFLDRQSEIMSSEEERQLHARLHCYYGMTKADLSSDRRVESRAYVYNMRNYRWENEFGPFDGKGSVNWEHVWALLHVVSMHVHEEDVPPPMSLLHTQAVIPRDMNMDEVGDWAGIEGLWRVSFCFCDHRELLRYNESAATNAGPLDTSIFASVGFREVFRSLDVEFRVINTQVDPQHPTRPRLYFVGEMGNPPSSTMTGRVQMTADDQVQWHFVSGDQGHAIWSSEGVQIGGLRSSFGVLGSWTTIFHDGDDPVGPFWLRKSDIRGANGAAL